MNIKDKFNFDYKFFILITNIFAGLVLAVVFFRFKSISPFYLVIPLFSAFFNSIFSCYGLEKRFIKMKEMAIRDKLTGLFNRQLFEEQLTLELAQSRREKTHLSMLMIDLDNFQQFNDTFGHPEGDLALKKIANLLESAARESDICCRYSGQKFGVILPGTPTQGSAYVANRIRKFIELESIGKPVITITSSIGIANFPTDCTTKKELISIAKNNLFLAKNRGKNRIQYLSPSEAPT